MARDAEGEILEESSPEETVAVNMALAYWGTRWGIVKGDEADMVRVFQGLYRRGELAGLRGAMATVAKVVEPTTGAKEGEHGGA